MYMPSSAVTSDVGHAHRTHSARARPYSAAASSSTATATAGAVPRAVRRGIHEATLRPALAATLPALRREPAASAAHRPRHDRVSTHARSAKSAAVTSRSTPQPRLPPLTPAPLGGPLRPSAAEDTIAAAPAAPLREEGLPRAEAAEAAEAAEPRDDGGVAALTRLAPCPPPTRPAAATTTTTTTTRAAVAAAAPLGSDVAVVACPAHPVLAELAAALTARQAATSAEPQTGALSLCELAELYTLAANASAVRGSAMAMPLEETYAYYHEALRYVVLPATATAENDKAVRTPGPHAVQDCFANDPQLRRVLGALVQSNMAVEQRQSFACPPSETQLSLLLALDALDGALATLVLYNLAALFFSEGQMEDATEALARCVELAQACLAVPAPVPVSAVPSVGEQRDQAVHRAFITFHATHLVLCHLLIAAFAAWCGAEASVEQYHCQLAAGAAATYLPVSHALRHRCMKRLKAAQSGVHHTVVADTTTPSGPRAHMAGEPRPPPQPLLFYGDVLPIFEGARHTSAEAAMDSTAAWLARPVEVHELLVFSRQVTRSSELQVYVVDARRALQPLHAREPSPAPHSTRTTTRETTAAVPSSVDASLTASLQQFGVRLVTAREHGGHGAHAADPRQATALGHATSTGLSASPPVVSTLPSAVFKRYHRLKASTAKVVDAHQLSATGTESGAVPRPTTATITASTTEAAPPSLHEMDRELLRYSRLVRGEEAADAPNGEAEVDVPRDPDAHAACCIQRGYRCHRARREADRRARAIAEERQRQVGDGDDEGDGAGFPTPMARDPAEEAARVLQRQTRRWLAQQRACAARDRREKLAWLRRRGAARCLAQRRYTQLEARRQRERLTPPAMCVQRWWRGRLVQRQQLLGARQAAVQAYLGAQESQFEARVGATGWHAAQAARTLLAVLRGARDRAYMTQQHARLAQAKAILRRWVWRHRARALRTTHTAARFADWQAQRQRELEVDAATVIQARVRAWLARRRYLHRPSPEEAAVRIQGHWRRHHHRRELARTYQVTQQRQLEQYAATLVQATWRMHRTRKAVAAQLQYLLWDRHVYAQRIQRAWRAWSARQVVLRECAYVARCEAQRQRQERRYVAAVRVQATVRMFLTRCRRYAQRQPIWPVQWRRTDAGPARRTDAATAPINPYDDTSDASEADEGEETTDDEGEEEEEEEEEAVEEEEFEEEEVDDDDDDDELRTSTASIHSRTSNTTAPPPLRSRSPTHELATLSTTEDEDEEGDAVPWRADPSPPSLAESDGKASIDSTSPSLIAYAARGSSVAFEGPDKIQAAVMIQKHWRGYSVRKHYEFYYEIYYEEVEVTDEEGEEEEEEEEVAEL